MKVASVEINGIRVAPGERVSIDLPVARLYTHTSLAMPIQVVRGKRPGPSVFISAAIHGDELNGVEIIRRLLKHRALRGMKGTLYAVPIVNVHGFLNRSRYLPDRRDLNRSFPGSDNGSLAAQIAQLFMREIVARCSYGIDLHTGAVHRENIPQIRANLDDPETDRLARSFGVPVLINATLRDGSLRMAAAEKGVAMLLYEAGEALRLDEVSIRAGLKGILNVMRALEMLPAKKSPGTSGRTKQTVVAQTSTWLRAPESGILRTLVPLGARVGNGDLLGVIADPFGESEAQLCASDEGIVIGRSQLPVVHKGEALYHIAHFSKLDRAAKDVEEFQEFTQPDVVITDNIEPPII
jgi:uncharacterized protein